jgi:GNAT superfamily N-acetyltransferase
MLILGPLLDHKGVDGVAVERVEDEAGIADCVAVNAEAYATYGMPSEVLPELFDNAAALVDDPAAHVVVARRDGDAVATAMTFESDGVASVQWVGTVSAARGSGLGALVTTAVTNLAFERGATSVTLQASPMGEPIYRSLGYETVYRYSEFVRWPKPPTIS